MSLRFWLSFQVRCVVVLSPASFCLRRLFYPRPTRTAIVAYNVIYNVYGKSLVLNTLDLGLLNFYHK